MADVGYLSQLSTSTLSRLWPDPVWLDVVSGASLQRLITAVPGLLAYVQARSHSARLESALRRCAESGLDVRTERLIALVRAGQSPQWLATVLEAAAAVVRMDARESTAALARCWGAAPSHALDAVFSLDPHGLVADPNTLADKAIELIGTLDTHANAVSETVGYGILVHKLTRLTGQVPAAATAKTADRCAAFAHRSGVIGVLLQGGDVDASVAYARELATTPLLARNELWSLGTFCGDLDLGPEIGPHRTPLRRTATEVITDVLNLNDAYLHYLLTAALPVLLAYDSSFGGRHAQLRDAVRRRLDLGSSDPRVTAAAQDLLEAMR